jgi:hypothetical protein
MAKAGSLDLECLWAGIGIVQAFTLLGLLYHLSGTVKTILALLSSVAVAYTNDGCLRCCE